MHHFTLVFSTLHEGIQHFTTRALTPEDALEAFNRDMDEPETADMLHVIQHSEPVYSIPQVSQLSKCIDRLILRLSRLEDVDSPAFNEALLTLQSVIGQKDGDLAGLHFSLNSDAWLNGSEADRLELLGQYLDAEFAELGLS